MLFEGGDEVVGSLCLGILSALLSGAVRLNEAESILLLDLLPYLRELKASALPSFSCSLRVKRQLHGSRQ